MKRIIVFCLIFFGLIFSQTLKSQKVEYPKFIFGHIVWEDESTSQSLRQMVDGYLERDIPVSGVIIDSPWETTYNSFEFDTTLFPDYQKLLKELKAKNIAIILWITSAINTEDPEYQFCREQGYFVPGFEKYKWWKGTGGLIDFKNPRAREFWHKRVDKALALDIDGWKVDGVDAMMILKNPKKRKEYARAYYSDFFYYSRKKTGKPIVIMARGIEEFNEHTLGLPGWLNPLRLGIPLTYAPREVSFMTWMGDQDPSWNGLRVAWRNFKKSAQAGYLNPGFDIFGYRSGKPDKELFIRWAQWGAFSPLMENGGIAEHRPWAYDEQTVEIYRQLAVWHEELGWYLYSLAEKRYLQGKSLVEILKDQSYLLGRDVFITRISRPGGKARIEFPPGNWRYWYELSECHQAGEKLRKTFPLEEYPVYLRSGSLIPLWVSSSYGRHQLNPDFNQQDTFWLIPGEGQGSRELIYPYPKMSKARVSWKRDPRTLELFAQNLKKPVVVLVEGVEHLPKKVLANGKRLKSKPCPKISPRDDSGFCLKPAQLYILISPSKGRAELAVEF